MFVNREQEISFLNRLFERDGAQLVVVWGRRRVGKTALLQHFAQDRRILYHVATLSTESLELERFSAQAAEFFQDALLAIQPLASWQAALSYLCDRARREPGSWGLVLDEFPYLVQASPRLPSLMQAAWDEHLKATQIKLILCGSSVTMMESTFFAPRAPLYGRRTGQWRVEPFGPVELGLMFPGKGLPDLVELYCILGGVPMYAERFSARAPLFDNIRDHILTKGEALYQEVPFLLREELREPRVYQSILAAMAGGASKFSELSSKTGLDRAHLTGYLGSLADLGLVAREVPVTERRPEKSRRGLYVILDPFVRFWYRFVYPNLSRLEIGQAEGVLRDVVAPGLPGYLGRCVETPIRELFRRGPLRRFVPFEPAYLGRHWSPTEEFDLVAMDSERSRAVVGEIKWSNTAAPARLAAQLLERIGSCKELQGVDVTPVLISRAGFRGDRRAEASYVDLRKE